MIINFRNRFNKVLTKKRVTQGLTPLLVLPKRFVKSALWLIMPCKHNPWSCLINIVTKLSSIDVRYD